VASPAAEAAARLGQRRRRHDMSGDAALLRAGTEHRRDRYGSCSIITIPTLRYDATRPDELERVPLPGQTHLTSPADLLPFHGKDQTGREEAEGVNE
jgi:hypothetical protein